MSAPGSPAAQLRAKARSHRRRFLRRLGIDARTLDAITRELLGHYARGQAQLDLVDESGAAAGRDYWAAYNAVTRTLYRLEERVRELGLDASKNGGRGNGRARLERHLSENYGGQR